MAPEATAAGFTSPQWTLTVTTSMGTTVYGPSGTQFASTWTSANFGPSFPPETETQRLVREFGEELQRYLDTFALWIGMGRAIRREQFFARRLRSAFEYRSVPRRRTCSQASRWMAVIS